MFTAHFTKGRVALSALAVGAVVALAGCSSSDPLDEGSGATAGSETIVVGSQDYYSNEILAEIYAQALENDGFTVDRQLRIGQREIYLPEIESGSIDVFPEYDGSLLQALEPDATATTADDVYSALGDALPDGLRALDAAEASDQNSYTVTQAFADKWDLTDIASLKNVTDPIVVGGNSELQTRPYGPDTLQSKYGITTTFQAIEDSGGSTTVDALTSDQIQLANVYTADPNIQKNDLVALEDPDGLFVADNVVPIVSSKITDDAAEVLNAVSAKLTADDLVALNSESVNEQKSASAIAGEWLKSAGLVD
ncbi:glycine/betaine ABC transporter [Rathayibacter sp. AY1G1]|jgi:osmoprotectant transport system substrate-binding protein|uniref:glycine betaine ABC transporter substrate-binding protein n=1 Tax=unclassified Rathayibacter TaxID=2609250 RepID=UPI000CE920E6|nr:MULTISPECIES: ABC transporter substrate-binding protein [unclassified Rathayibacter]PPF12910.1 glycine/betaine ABC transporter [Rathayibacter sp. AY1A5]PPF20130.1 glycine/betaine ABC transporter [Rathayibacter sp. AY1A4]PPF22573.1 glycine/betaine ABC transporter [Rathayibacter sp. AY1A7]PPF30056.1 glycine/betaine ABC transporter [Rathayibacter sp. AY1F2]PPF30710.1 glycine/betaine ABC transporter [Rathayibacter sp. AY1A3]